MQQLNDAGINNVTGINHVTGINNAGVQVTYNHKELRMTTIK